MARSNAAAATARLRKTFRYPSDDEDNTSDLAEAMDEQEQESLIQTLSHRNANRNAQTRLLLLALPLLSTIPYLLAFLPSSSSSSDSSRKVLGIIGLSSLAATTFLTWKKSPEKTGIPILDGLTEPNARATHKSFSRKAILAARGADRNGGPLEVYLPYLNMLLALLSALTGLVQGHRLQHEAAQGVHPVMLGALPGVVYSVVLGAKVVMASVDPERELGGLRYGYKGA